MTDINELAREMRDRVTRHPDGKLLCRDAKVILDDRDRLIAENERLMSHLKAAVKREENYIAARDALAAKAEQHQLDAAYWRGKYEAGKQERGELCVEVSRLAAKRDAQKRRGDNHAETLRGVRKWIVEGDIERALLWVSDGLSGYTESAETTLANEISRREAAESARDALAAKLAEAERERDEARTDNSLFHTAGFNAATILAESRASTLEKEAERLREALTKIRDVALNEDEADELTDFVLGTVDAALSPQGGPDASALADTAPAEGGGLRVIEGGGCGHEGWSFEKDGRGCPKCGKLIADFGD